MYWAEFLESIAMASEEAGAKWMLTPCIFPAEQIFEIILSLNVLHEQQQPLYLFLAGKRNARAEYSSLEME